MSDSSPQPNVLPAGPANLSLWFWAAIGAVGVGAGLCGGLLMRLLGFVQHIAWQYSGDDVLAAVQHTGAARRIAVLVAAGCLVAAVHWLLSQRSGGNTAELTAAIWFHAGRLAPVRTAVNAVLSIVIVGMGASLGRESAPKQAGALVASVLAGWVGLPDGQRRLLVACGAGAGMAAVYNVPFGGALFALEVLLGSLSLPLVAPALAASFVATGTSWLLLPDRATYGISAFQISWGQVGWAVLAGPLAGLASVGFVRLIVWADGRKPSGWQALVMPVAVLGGLGCLAAPYPQLLGNGKDLAQLAFSGEVGLGLLATLAVLKPLVTAACLGSGAPGGLFTPSIAFGAMAGGALGQVWEGLLHTGAPSGSYAMLGAGAVLAATTQGPVSAIVMLTELTRRLDAFMLPVLIIVAGAVAVARRIEPRSVYSGRIQAARSAAKQADAETPSEVISGSARYPELLHRLLRQGDHAAPIHVVDEHGKPMGEVSRKEAVNPGRELAPLDTATAADFIQR